SGPSVGIFGIMLEQNRVMTDDPESAVLHDVIDFIRRGEPIPDDLKLRASGPTGAGAIASFPPEALTYMRECDATDPAAAIAHYEKPVLIVQGGADTNVPTHHGEALRNARGTRPTTYAFFPELQHMYKQVPPGTPPVEDFGYPGPTDPRVADAIANWMSSL
ncbi:MAG TPA: alpha/beta hydrolase, partial [Gemmatimonadaceae bacterium]